MENRKYSTEQKITALEYQEYMCGGCGQDLYSHQLSFCEAHHIVPWFMGGATSQENLIILCPNCHTYHDNLAICGVFYGGYGHEDIDESQLRNIAMFESSNNQCLKNKNNQAIIHHIYSYEEEVLSKPKKPNHHDSIIYSKEYGKR